ncbi:hypothetical protein BST66_20695 [Bradyrhizobium canariense]|nr:hypothetical protein BST66_20695 [Bradyrhizobium canariense]OSI50016.1 hypothetical protein BSZ15_33580 [Bradyrhizobium canariense]
MIVDLLYGELVSAVTCSSCKDGMAAVPEASSTEVEGQRVIMPPAASNATTAMAAIVRRIMVGLRFRGP